MNTAVVHIGHTKTGSTTLQRFLSDTRQFLRTKAVCYPRSLTIDGDQHIALSLICMKIDPGKIFLARALHNLNDEAEVQAFAAQNVAALKEELKETECSTVIFSDEGLSGLTAASEVHKLRDFLTDAGFEQIKVVCYLRRPDSHYESYASQNVASGLYTDGMAIHFPHLLTEIHWYYSYYENLKIWLDEFGLENMRVSIYEDFSNNENGILEDFLTHVDVLDLFHPIEMGRLNTSASGTAILVMNEINRRISLTPNKTPLEALSFARETTKKVSGALNDGEKFKITSSVAKRFNDRFAESTEAVARTFFPERGTLFPEIQPSEGTKVDFGSARINSLIDETWQRWLDRRS